MQMMIRDAQNREDLQRVTAENSQLKLKVMEFRKLYSRPRSATNNKNKNNSAPPLVPLTPKKTPWSRKAATPEPSPGLMVFEDILQDMDAGGPTGRSSVLHRGQMGRFHAGAGFGALSSKPPQLLTALTHQEVHRHSPPSKSPCPLCGHVAAAVSCPSTDGSDTDVTLTQELLVGQRNKATSTRELENIVAVRRSVRLLGFEVPVPLFVAMLIHVVDTFLLLLGHLCFAEYPWLEFPGLRFKVVRALREVRGRVERHSACS